MTFRPFTTIKKYKALVEVLEKRIDLHQKIDDAKDAIIASHERREKALEATCVALQQRPTTVQVVGFTQVPDVEELEKLVNVSFMNAPDSILRQAIDGTQGYSKLQPGEVTTTRFVLMKMCRSAAMRELERRISNE
jgi:hypothetical protein